jgi:hypothetical protein
MRERKSRALRVAFACDDDRRGIVDQALDVAPERRIRIIESFQQF